MLFRDKSNMRYTTCMPELSVSQFQAITQMIRHLVLESTSQAQSGHPTSCFSAVELMSTLVFDGFFKAKLDDPKYPNNDRLIFSKGHAAPLFYALYSVAGVIPKDEMLRLRQFESPLEGHPTMRFPFTEAATGSLGQGLSIGMGMALNAKLDKLSYRTFVLLGDSEMAEGSNYEALALAAHYHLDNLIGIIDVNRLGQRGVTMYGHDTAEYEERVKAFGWQTYLVHDGHDFEQIKAAYRFALSHTGTPIMIIAKTMKGKGCSIWEDQENWHSKQLHGEQLQQCLAEIGAVDDNLMATIALPEELEPKGIGGADTIVDQAITIIEYKKYSTKEGVGIGVANAGYANESVVVLDAEVSNSTHSDVFQKRFPNRFFEMFIAEQNMVGAALGFSRRGKIPCVFTFSAFLSRAFDQIRMSQYSNPNIKFIGSYAGVSLGKDGSSQMGLEDMAMFRSVQHCVVLQPADAVAAASLARQAIDHNGNVYLRTFREPVEQLYALDEQFPIGGSKILRLSNRDRLTVIASGITVHEALKAHDQLSVEGIKIRVLDLYSISPIDRETLRKMAFQTKALLVVEDHYEAGGVAEAVRTALGKDAGKVHSLCVRKMPRSGTPEDLLHYEMIDAAAIIEKVKSIIA